MLWRSWKLAGSRRQKHRSKIALHFPKTESTVFVYKNGTVRVFIRLFFKQGEILMDKHIQKALAIAKGCKVETPYDIYMFCSESEANKFCEYVNSDSEYNDPEIGPIVEHCYFINTAYLDE